MVRSLLWCLLVLLAPLIGQQEPFFELAETLLGGGEYQIKGAGEGLFGGVSGDPTCLLYDVSGEPCLVLKGFIDNPAGFEQERQAAIAFGSYSPKQALYPELRGELERVVEGKKVQILAFTFWKGTPLDQLRSDSNKFFTTWERYGAAVAELGQLRGKRSGKIGAPIAARWRRWVQSAKPHLKSAEKIEERLEQFLQKEHPLGISHGDIHAGNVILLEDGRLGLIDFSEAHLTLDGSGYLGSDCIQGCFMRHFDEEPDQIQAAFMRGYQQVSDWSPSTEEVELFEHLFAYWWIDWYLERENAGRLTSEVKGILPEWCQLFRSKEL